MGEIYYYMDVTKPWYLSKTIWLNLFGFVAMVVPASSAWIAAHLSESGGVFAAANFLLRFFFTDKAIE